MTSRQNQPSNSPSPTPTGTLQKKTGTKSTPVVNANAGGGTEQKTNEEGKKSLTPFQRLAPADSKASPQPSDKLKGMVEQRRSEQKQSDKGTPSGEAKHSMTKNPLATPLSKGSAVSKQSDLSSANRTSKKGKDDDLSSSKAQSKNASNVKDSKTKSPRIPDVPAFQGRTLDDHFGKQATKSVGKELDRSRLSKDKKELGKLSSHSENLMYGRNAETLSDDQQEVAPSNKSKQKTVPSDFSAHMNLQDYLNDAETTIHITARRVEEVEVEAPRTSSAKASTSRKGTPKQTGSATKGSKGKADPRNYLSDENVETVRSGKKVHQAGDLGIKMENGALNQDDDETGETRQKVERKEYSIYEDWRIISSIQGERDKGQAKALYSRVLWENLEDPMTGRRLLDNKRTSESMRDRYKRYLSNLDDDEVEKIEQFCKDNSIEDLKKNHCIFKKIEGLRKLVSISPQLSYNPEKISRKTPYGTKPKKNEPTAQAGRVEEDFLGDDVLEEANDGVARHEQLIPDDYEIDENEQVVKVRPASRSRPQRVEESSINNESKRMNATSSAWASKERGNSKLMSENVLEGTVYELNENGVEENLHDQEIEWQADPNSRKSSRKRPHDENYITKKDLKLVRKSEDYEAKSLPLSAVFRNRKPFQDLSSINNNYMIYVDFKEGFRQFVNHESEKQNEENLKNIQISRLAEKYALHRSDLILLLRKVTYDFETLEEYLKKKDSRLLWSDDEDRDLLEQNLTAIRYLKMIKGEENVEKRKEFLAKYLA